MIYLALIAVLVFCLEMFCYFVLEDYISEMSIDEFLLYNKPLGAMIVFIIFLKNDRL